MKTYSPPFSLLQSTYQPAWKRLCFRYGVLVCLLSIFCYLTGCNATKDPMTAVPPEAKDTDEFMIVDCLLPGQVRKLGGNFTYITQRRPIKTATSDCEIRGGEYVAYDRADYSTALKIWLPLAQQGDPVAQTYVGEIYEKGLGLAPDFQVAAHWYHKAAEQNHSRAQINLGHLYEKGLGVAPDQQKALNLYRLASGIRDDALLFASTLNATYVPREQFEAQETALREQRQKAERLQVRLTKIDKALTERNQTLQAAEEQLQQTEMALKAFTEQSSSPLLLGKNANSEREQAHNARIEKLLSEQEALQRQLRESNQANTELLARHQQLNERLKETESNKQAYENQLQALQAQLDSWRRQVAESETAAASLRQRLQQMEQAAGEATPEVLALRAELADKDKTLTEKRQQLAAIEADNNNKISQLRTALGELSDSQHAILKENQAYEARLAAAQQKLKQREQELAATNQRLSEAEQALVSVSEGHQQASQQEAVLMRKVALMEDNRTQLQQQLSQFQQQNQALDAKQKKLRASLEQAQSTKAGYLQQLRELEQQLMAHQQRLQESQQALAQTEQRLQQERDRLLSEREKGAQLTPTILALQDDLAEKNRNLIDEQKRLADFQKKNSDKQKTLEKEVAKLDAQQKSLQAENLAYQKQLVALNKKLGEREAELASLGQQLLLNQAELELARTEKTEALSSLSAEHERAMAEERDKLQQLTRDYQQQLSLVAKQKQEIEALQQQAQQALLDAPKPAAGNVVQVAVNDYPGIEIIEPPVVLTRSRASVRVNRVQGERQVIGKVMAPAGLMSLSVNGQPHQVMDNNLFRTSVSLQGDPTPVDVVVVDKKGRRAAVSFSFVAQDQHNGYRSPQTASVRKTAVEDTLSLGDYYALIIGNNNYQHFSTLSTAVNDARETERILRFKYNFKTRLLLNADRYAILSSLNELRKTLKPEDNLLIYYAGHGKLDVPNNRGYWLPVDAESDNISNWISNTAITDILNVTEAKHILVVADSCYSGTLTQTPLARVETDIPQDVRQEWIKVMNETRARITLTSGGVEPVLDGGGGTHSVFAKAFIDTLRANNGILEGYSLYSKVLNRMASVPAASGQVPQYAPIHLAGHESGEFFFKSI